MMAAPVSVGVHSAATSWWGGTPALVGVGAYITTIPIPFYSDHCAAFAGCSIVMMTCSIRMCHYVHPLPQWSLVQR